MVLELCVALPTALKKSGVAQVLNAVMGYAARQRAKDADSGAAVQPPQLSWPRCISGDEAEVICCMQSLLSAHIVEPLIMGITGYYRVQLLWHSCEALCVWHAHVITAQVMTCP